MRWLILYIILGLINFQTSTMVSEEELSEIEQGMQINSLEQDCQKMAEKFVKQLYELKGDDVLSGSSFILGKSQKKEYEKLKKEKMKEEVKKTKQIFVSMAQEYSTRLHRVKTWFNKTKMRRKKTDEKEDLKDRYQEIVELTLIIKDHLEEQKEYLSQDNEKKDAKISKCKKCVQGLVGTVVSETLAFIIGYIYNSSANRKTVTITCDSNYDYCVTLANMNSSFSKCSELIKKCS